MPEMVPIIDDDDKREAVIGMSEGCIIPAVGALVNAVFNATGIRIRELPITPDKLPHWSEWATKNAPKRIKR